MADDSKHAYAKDHEARARTPLSDVVDPHFFPANAAALVQSLLQLSSEQRHVLERELNRSDEDALLVLRLNPNWHDHPRDVASSAVCDAIATFAMTGDTALRRDASDGCHRWIFHFDRYQDIGICQRAMRALYPEAFALSPCAIAAIVAAGADQALLQGHSEPLAFAAVVIKIGVRQDDAGVYHFFYL